MYREIFCTVFYILLDRLLPHDYPSFELFHSHKNKCVALHSLKFHYKRNTKIHTYIFLPVVVRDRHFFYLWKERRLFKEAILCQISKFRYPVYRVWRGYFSRVGRCHFNIKKIIKCRRLDTEMWRFGSVWLNYYRLHRRKGGILSMKCKRK